MTDTVATRSPSRLTSPAALIGAGVLVASLGAAAGWMIHSSQPAQPDAAKMALAPNESVVAPAAPVAPANAQQQALSGAPAQTTPAPAPVESHATAPSHHTTRHEPTHHTSNGSTSTQSAQGSSASRGEPVPTQKVAACDNCGIVEGVRAVQHKGEGSGLGAVTGAVLGGVLGHQMGGGNGKSAMTVLGAVGGGLAGNEVEKRAKAETVYEVRVRMDDGSVRTLTQKTAPTPGAHVVVEGNSMRVVAARSGDGV